MDFGGREEIDRVSARKAEDKAESNARRYAPLSRPSGGDLYPSIVGGTANGHIRSRWIFPSGLVVFLQTQPFSSDPNRTFFAERNPPARYSPPDGTVELIAPIPAIPGWKKILVFLSPLGDG